MNDTDECEHGNTAFNCSECLAEEGKERLVERIAQAKTAHIFTDSEKQKIITALQERQKLMQDINQLRRLVNLSECAIDLVLCEDDRRQLKLEIDQLHKLHHVIYDRITYLKKEIRDNTPVNSKVGGIESDNEELSYLLKLIKGELAS